MSYWTKYAFSALIYTAVSTVYGATIDVGYDASSLAPGSISNWAPSTNTTGQDFTWTNATTATVNTGTTNFVGVTEWVSTPNFSLINSGGDSFHEKTGSGIRDTSWEVVFRPSSFADTGLRTIFNTGGDVRGTALVISGSTLTWRFQDNSNVNERVFVSVDLSSIGTADEFYHFVGLIDLQTGSGDPAIGTVYINGVALPTVTSIGNVGDADGGDLAQLGLGSNIPTGGQNDDPTGAFTGDIAVFNFYDNQLLTLTEVLDAYANIPEPSSTCLVIAGISFTIMARRRRFA